MYYICKDHLDEKPDYRYPQGKIVNITKMSQLIELRDIYKIVELIEYSIETIIPSTMRKYGYRKQSFSLDTVKSRRLNFFNRRTFGKLYLVFQNPEVIVYKTAAGKESRDCIIGYIDKETGKKVFF